MDLDLSYGSFNTFSPAVTGAYAAEKTAALVSLSHLSSDGYRDAEFVNYNAFFSGSAAAWEKSRFSLTGNIYQSEYHPKGSLTYYTPNDVQEDNLKYAKLDYDYVFEEMSLKVSGYASESKRKYRSPALSKDGYTANTYGTQADFIYKNILLAGAEWWQDNYKREDLLTDTTMTDKSKENTAFYVQANIDIGKLRIIPGLRGDIDSEYGDVVTPAISAIYSVNDKVKVSANSGRVWRAPTFSELYDDYPSWWMYGNPGLKPEYGISSDIGAEYSYGKIKAACTAFYIASKDLIKNITDPVTFEMRPQNIAKARQYGLELEGGYIMNSWLKHNFNYTFLKAENSDTGEILPYSPESAVNYSVTVKPVEKLSVCAQAIYKSGQKVSGAPDLDGYFTLDLNVSYRINENFTCWVKGFNITDTDYQMYSDYPMPGATVYAGINFKFWK
ncbi:MAG: TonB-dependent receptor [Endomicrobia bacterium]|nr:TonB-dependent receptor [Endomicrobiia bacterium]